MRLWAHYRAEKGAKAALAASSQLELQPSEELNHLMGTYTIDSAVSDEVLVRMEQHFCLHALLPYMRRMRERLLNEERPHKSRDDDDD